MVNTYTHACTGTCAHTRLTIWATVLDFWPSPVAAKRLAVKGQWGQLRGQHSSESLSPSANYLHMCRPSELPPFPKPTRRCSWLVRLSCWQADRGTQRDVNELVKQRAKTVENGNNNTLLIVNDCVYMTLEKTALLPYSDCNWRTDKHVNDLVWLWSEF